MIDTLLSFVAPHLCCECSKIGTLLCHYCKYNIISDMFLQCIVCGAPAEKRGICTTCRPPYEQAWCVGERSGSLQRLIDLYKFQNTYAAYRPLGDLLLGALPHMPPETVIVPIPTVPGHIRRRGYDHSLLLARYIAKKRGLVMQKALRRTTSTTQRGVGRRQRITQAKQAFKAPKPLSSDVPYLLIDDVVTTGATLHYAAKELEAAGATQIWAAAIARQPLDS